MIGAFDCSAGSCRFEPSIAQHRKTDYGYPTVNEYPSVEG